jgi:hypothetical protein
MPTLHELTVEVLLMILKFINVQYIDTILTKTSEGMRRTLYSNMSQIGNATEGHIDLVITPTYDIEEDAEVFHPVTKKRGQYSQPIRQYLPRTVFLTQPVTCVGTSESGISKHEQAMIQFEEFVKKQQKEENGVFIIRELWLHGSIVTRQNGAPAGDSDQLNAWEMREAMGLDSLCGGRLSPHPAAFTLSLCEVEWGVMTKTDLLKRTDKLELHAAARPLHWTYGKHRELEHVHDSWFQLPTSVKHITVDGYLPPVTVSEQDKSSESNSLQEVHIMGCSKQEQVSLWVQWLLATRCDLRLVLHGGPYDGYPDIEFPEDFINGIREKTNEETILFEYVIDK